MVVLVHNFKRQVVLNLSSILNDKWPLTVPLFLFRTTYLLLFRRRQWAVLMDAVLESVSLRYVIIYA